MIAKDGSELAELRKRIRHSTAHVMADVVTAMFPQAKLAIGPPTDEGFYYDFLVDKPLHRSGTHLFVVALACYPLPRSFVDLKFDFLAVELCLKFSQKFVNNALDHFHRKSIELDDSIQPIAKLRGEHFLDDF